MGIADLMGRKIVILSGLGLQFVITLLILLLPKKLFLLYIFIALLGIRAPMASHVTAVLNY